MTSVIDHWIGNEDPFTIYLSHPISRPRRLYKSEGVWHPVVGQFNKLQKEFFEKDLICIMPPAIDEYRIRREKAKNVLSTRRPILEERWPLNSDIGNLLYNLPAGESNVNYTNILNFKKWIEDEGKFVDLAVGEVSSTEIGGMTDKVLRLFERQIELQISSRDHLFVSLCKGILVFRPLFLDGAFSSGVEAELAHWALLANLNSALHGE